MDAPQPSVQPEVQVAPHPPHVHATLQASGPHLVPSASLGASSLGLQGREEGAVTSPELRLQRRGCSC